MIFKKSLFWRYSIQISFNHTRPIREQGGLRQVRKEP